MKKPSDTAPNAASLRQLAERQLATKAKTLAGNLIGERRLMHELQVHQIELEMQNDALRQAQVALEESRDRYADLYEFAPVGYLTLNDIGLITEVNLTGADLFGEDRAKLLHRRFLSLIVSADQDRWHRHFLSARRHHGKQTCELKLNRSDGVIFDANLDCLLTKRRASTILRQCSDQFRQLISRRYQAG